VFADVKLNIVPAPVDLRHLVRDHRYSISVLRGADGEGRKFN